MCIPGVYIIIFILSVNLHSYVHVITACTSVYCSVCIVAVLTLPRHKYLPKQAEICVLSIITPGIKPLI